MRLSRHNMFMEIARVVAQRGTCPRLCVGAVIVYNGKHIVAHGYNGAPSGQPHCTDVGCLMSPDGCIRSVHAEINAIKISDKIDWDDDDLDLTMYVTHSPCRDCAIALVEFGIKAVYFETPYRSTKGLSILSGQGVPIFRVMPNGYIIEGTEGKLIETD